MSVDADPSPAAVDPQRLLYSVRAVAGFVLSLVGVIPCFWIVQVPGVAGVVLGALGLRDTRDGARRGRGMALAAVVIGAVLVVFAIVVVLILATNEDCTWTDGRFRCDFD